MESLTFVRAIDTIDRHLSAMFVDLRQLAGVSASDPSANKRAASSSSEWVEVDRLTGQTYSWPKDAGGTEEYDPFVRYQSNGQNLALAHNVEKVPVKSKERRQVWVFQMGSGGGSKLPVTPFIEADDYDTTGEMVSIIRGNGETGRKMFAPNATLPPVYDGLKIEILGDRVDGHYRMLAVVAHKDDVQSMLRHGAAQISLRK